MFENLDWLRGISILLVMLHHVPTTYGPLNVFQQNGRYGVSIFFVISGFLIASLLIREQGRYGAISLKQFYIRRSLRLFPLYYSVLFVYLGLICIFHIHTPENQQIFKDKFIYHALYLNNLTADPTVGPFFYSWSLAVEEQFYLAFSLLMVWANRDVIVGLFLSALVAKPLLLTAGIADPHALGWRVALSYEEPILLGVLLAYALDTERGYNLLRHLGRPMVLACSGLLLIGMLSVMDFKSKHGFAAQSLYLVMTMTVAGCCVRSNIPVAGNRLLHHVGKISYGIYLTHMLVIMSVKRVVGGPWPVLAVSGVCVVILCSLIYRYFEHPILQFKNRFSPLKRRVKPGAAHSYLV